jgi:lipopolysaccharide transport system permease protein
VIWVVLQPLLAAGIFSFVFGKVAKMPSDGVPYFLFSYAGLLGWSLFNNTVTKVAGSLVGNTQLLTKVYFSRLILPLSNVPSALVDFVVGAVMLAIMMAASHVLPSSAVLLLPVWITALLLLGLGAGLLSCSLSVTYRDIQYILPVFMQLLLYGTPIAYSISAVPERLRLIYYLNPLSAPMEAFRSCILGTPMPGLGPLLYSLATAIVVQLAGIYAFRRLERTFADVI